MKITKIKNTTPYDISNAFHDAISKSRFTAQLQFIGKHIKIADIRLKESKPYCGNHPAACERGGSHRKAKYLEGADWIEFNDLVNDLLDSLNCSANVASSVCIIRKGLKRRIFYSYNRLSFGNNQWHKDEVESSAWGNYCGEKAPRSYFPDGTPGIISNQYHVVG